MSITTWWSSLRMHWRPMWVLSTHIPSCASATLSGSKDLAFVTAAAQKRTASSEPAAMFASVPNFFLKRALYACMFGSGLYGEKWFSCTNPSIGSAIDARSCWSRKQSMPAILYFLVIPNEWSWVISRSESVPANATKSTSGFDWLMAPNQGLKSFVSSGARSEEHTSELQSRLHLVCRLLLEKKKNTNVV